MVDEIFSEFQVKNGRLMNPGEGINYEFKENFSWASKEKYAKIMASFANASGGYLLFGIKDDGEIVGLLTTNFIDRDPADFSSVLNSMFSPALSWKKSTFELDGRKIGVIRVDESAEKPIISHKNTQEVKEGDIYFRYAGQTEKIKYPELKTIIDISRRKYGEMLLRDLKLIVDKGPETIKLLDLEELKESKEDDIFIIDSGSKDTSIKVHKATEDEQARGIGIKVVNVEGKVIPITVKTYANISSEMIVHVFLEQELPGDFEPQGFIERLPYETSGLVPVYFYIKKANLTVSEAVELIKKARSTTRGRSTLIKRLTGGEYNFSSSGQGETLNSLMDGSLSIKGLKTYEVRYALQTIRSYSKESLIKNWDKLKEVIRGLYDEYYMNPRLRKEVRMTICYVDITLFS